MKHTESEKIQGLIRDIAYERQKSRNLQRELEKTRTSLELQYHKTKKELIDVTFQRNMLLRLFHNDPSMSFGTFVDIWLHKFKKEWG